MSIFSARAVVAGYGGEPVVRGMSLEAGRGDVVGIVGANGAGKSTYLKALAGQVPRSTGAILIEELGIEHLAPHERVRRGLAYVPQMPDNIFPSLTVVENLEVGGYTRKRDRRRQFDEVFELFPDLQPAAKRRAGALSGGQRQMLSLARGMMSDPKVVLLDEPTAGLSPLHAQHVWGHIELIASRGSAVIVVEQNVRSALDHAHNVIVMVNGESALQGTAAEVAEHDLGQIFLGQREKRPRIGMA